MPAHLPVLRHGRNPGGRHAAGCPGADDAAGRIGAVPAQEHPPTARLACQQLFLPAPAGNRAGRGAGPLPQRDGAARPRTHALRAGRRRGGPLPRRDRRHRVWQGGAAAGRPGRARRRRGVAARALDGRGRWRAQRGARPAGHRHDGQELSQPVAGGRHQGQGPGRRPAPPAVFQFHLRPHLPDSELRAAQWAPPLRIHADAGPDPRTHGAPRHRAPLPVEARERRQVPHPAHARLHLQCADGRTVARRPGAAGWRRGAHDPTVHRPGHERRSARRLQPGLEARRGAARAGWRGAAGQL